MDVNYASGQELMNLGYLNKEDVRKLAGEPVQSLASNQNQQMGSQKSSAGSKTTSATALSSQQAQAIVRKKTLAREGVSTSWFQRLVIPIDNHLKSIWDIFILLLIAYSCFTTTYYFAFSPDLPQGLGYFETIVEICFGIDIILRFFHEYRDSETHEVVHDVRKIARKYLCTWFFFDLIAVLPIAQFLKIFGQTDNQYAVVIKLFRILRLPKFMRLLDTSKFDLLLDSILEREPKNPQEEKSRQEKMNIKYISRYAYKVFRLILIAIMLTYFLGSLWYFLVSIMTEDADQPNFIQKNKINQKSNIDKLILCCYFVLTTLATIGYGDLSPQTNSEKILGISLMIVGIAFFSYIMGNFNDVLINYDKKMGIVDRRNDLQKWMTSLDKFNPSQPIPRTLLRRINDHFNFFWKHDRLSSLTPEDKYLQTMPVPLRIQLINFLFNDIFIQFRLFFNKKKFNNSPFFYEVAFLFLPRQYEANTVLFSKGDEFHEILLQTDGEIECTLESDPVKVQRFFSKGYFLGDYEVLMDKRSMFTYKTTTNSVKFLSLPKHKFLKILSKYPEIMESMKQNSAELHLQQKNRFLNRLKTEMKAFAPEKEHKDEDLRRIFERAILPDKLLADHEANKASAGESAEAKPTVYSEPKLEQLNNRLEKTEDNIKGFSKSIEQFCNLMKKEMTDITKKLEDLKTKLIDQERK